MGYSVSVDKDVCMSAGLCVAYHPEAFQFDAHELSEPTADADRVADDALLDAARNCPTGAIIVRDADGTPVELF